MDQITQELHVERIATLSEDGLSWVVDVTGVDNDDQSLVGVLGRAMVQLTDGHFYVSQLVSSGEISQVTLTCPSGDAVLPSLTLTYQDVDGKRLAVISRYALDGIFYDMDGVTFDFAGKVCEIMGIDDIEVLNKHPMSTEILRRFYVENPNIFSDLDTVEEAINSVSQSMSDGYEVAALSAVGEHPNINEASADKTLAWYDATYWINGSTPSSYIVKESKDKQVFASPTHVLIDDYEKNFEQWKGPRVLWDARNPERSKRLVDAFLKMCTPAQNPTADYAYLFRVAIN